MVVRRPWFLLGGLLFLAAGRSYARRAANRRLPAASAAGGLPAALGTHIVRLLASATTG